MWTGTVQSIDNNRGILLVGVLYSNGTDSFTESHDMSGATMDSLTNVIQNKLDILNANDTLLSSLADPVVQQSLVIQTRDPMASVVGFKIQV